MSEIRPDVTTQRQNLTQTIVSTPYYFSFWDACKWFTEKHGVGWQNKVWGVIQFEGDWIRGDKP